MLDKYSVGKVLKEARKRSKLTQQQVADKYLAPRQLISNYERHESSPSAENFILLLDILNASVLIENGCAKIVEEKSIKVEKSGVKNIDKENM